MLIKDADRGPLGAASAGALSMDRLNRRLKLKAARMPALRRLSKMALRFFHKVKGPLARILLGQRNITAMRPPRQTPGFAMEHESQQPANFSLSGHQLQQDARKPDRLFSQVPPALIDTSHVIPPDSESRIYAFEDSGEPLRQLLFLRHLKGNAAGTDLGLGPHQALTHGDR